jgi:hypothetical protein
MSVPEVQEGACLAIRLFVGCVLIIPMIIQTIGLDLSGAVWTDSASNVSRPDPSGAVQVDASIRLVIGRSRELLQRSQRVSIGDLRVLLWIEHQMQNLAIVLDSCQSRCQSTSHNQTGLWRPGWIRHLT